MSPLWVKDAAAATVAIEATGTGTTNDPFRAVHAVVGTVTLIPSAVLATIVNVPNVLATVLNVHTVVATIPNNVTVNPVSGSVNIGGWIVPGHPQTKTLRQVYTSAQIDAVVVSNGGGSQLYITKQSAMLSAYQATNFGVPVRIGLGTANTPTTDQVVLVHPGIAPGSGVVEGNGAGIIAIGASDEDLRITCGTPFSGQLEVLTTYFRIP